METSKNSKARKLLNPFKGDKAIWFIFTLLAIISLVSVYSSIGFSAIVDGKTPERAFFKHFLFVLVTYVGVILLSNFDYRKFSRYSLLGYVISLVLLVMVLFFGNEDVAAGSGENRWLYLPLIGRFQPSELAKVVTVVFLARLLVQENDNLKDRTVFRNILLTVLAVVALIVKDNLSTAAIIFMVCYAMMRLAPVNVHHWRRALLGLILLGVLAIFLGTKLNIPYLARSETWTNRVDRWLNFNPDNTSQESMARMAVASGKLIGVGVGSTIHARLMTQADNDLIYAIIVEETGMAGGIVVFVLYAILYLRCIKIAWKCKGAFGRLMVAGLGTLIFLQAAIHISVSVGAMPVTGQTLPFISSGGTSYLCMGIALGIIQSVAYDVNLNDPEHAKTGRKKKAVEAEVASDVPNP